jgi:hypothetical protein
VIPSIQLDGTGLLSGFTELIAAVNAAMITIITMITVITMIMKNN